MPETSISAPPSPTAVAGQQAAPHARDPQPLACTPAQLWYLPAHASVPGHLAQPWAPPRAHRLWPRNPSAAHCWAGPRAAPSQALAPCLHPHGISLGKVWFLVFLPFQWLPKPSQCPGTGPAQTGAARGPPLRSRHGCSQGLCPGTQPPGATTQPLLPAPPRAFLGLTQRLEDPEPGQAGAGSRTCHMHPGTHVQLHGPVSTGTFRLCSRGETGRVKRDTSDREQKP